MNMSTPFVNRQRLVIKLSKCRSCNTMIKQCLHNKISTTGKHYVVVDDGWSRWSPRRGCSKSCDEGTQLWTRICTSLALPNEVKLCAGSRFEIRKCNVQQCPGDEQI